jgi:ribonucleoside-diphosphate reductase beta chain
MSKNLMNVSNNNNRSGNYPLFLGDDLGFSDTINVTYPEIEEMYLSQRAQYWTESEVTLSQDRLDLAEAPDSEKDVMVLNLLAQWLLDATASRGILETFSPFISNTELHEWLSIQSMFEVIHARTYSHIIRNCFVDSNAVLEKGKSDVMVQYRTGIIGKVFNDTYEIGVRWSQGDIVDEGVVRKQILKNMAVLYGLEAISFMASFACTFALAETGRYQGIGKLVSLICADELLHAEGDRKVFDAMFNKEGYRKEYVEIKDEIGAIFTSIVEQELKWSEYVFSEGRKVLGLNESLLKDYVYHIAKPVFDYLGLDWEYPVVSQNPLPFVDKYIDRNLVQGANQEIQNISYLIGNVDSDGVDEEFDF